MHKLHAMQAKINGSIDTPSIQAKRNGSIDTPSIHNYSGMSWLGF